MAGDRSTWSGTAASDVQSQVGRSAKRGGGVGGWEGGGTLWNEPVLVVNQKAKIFELTNEYNLYDQAGNQLGAVRQVGQSKAKKALRFVSNVDQFLTHRYEVVDAQGAVQMRIVRPAKFMKSKVQVTDAAGNEVGWILQDNIVGKKKLSLQAGGTTLGHISAENWRAWDFAITDTAGTEIGRVTKTWEGLGKAMFTTADHYVVTIHRPLDDPLRWLVIASAVSIDTALKQDSG